MSEPTVKVYKYPTTYIKKNGDESIYYKTVHRTVTPRKRQRLALTDEQKERCLYWYDLLHSIPATLRVLKTENIVISAYYFRELL